MAPLIKALLIDPFQREIYSLSVDPDARIHPLLDCTTIQAVELGFSAFGISHVAWVDQEAILRQPFVYPHWILPKSNGGEPMTGYGLITGYDEDGRMLPAMVPPEAFAAIIHWEHWRGRLSIDDVIPQMMRVYDLS